MSAAVASASPAVAGEEYPASTRDFDPIELGVIRVDGRIESPAQGYSICFCLLFEIGQRDGVMRASTGVTGRFRSLVIIVALAFYRRSLQRELAPHIPPSTMSSSWKYESAMRFILPRTWIRSLTWEPKGTRGLRFLSGRGMLEDLGAMMKCCLEIDERKMRGKTCRKRVMKARCVARRGCWGKDEKSELWL